MSQSDAETVVQADDGTEIAIRRAVMFREGTIAVSVHLADGTGATAYLTPLMARHVIDALAHRLGGERSEAE